MFIVPAHCTWLEASARDPLQGHVYINMAAGILSNKLNYMALERACDALYAILSNQKGTSHMRGALRRHGRASSRIDALGNQRPVLQDLYCFSSAVCVLFCPIVAIKKRKNQRTSV